MPHAQRWPKPTWSCSYVQFHSLALQRTFPMHWKGGHQRVRGGAEQYLCASEQLPCHGLLSYHSAACTALAEAGVHSCSCIEFQSGPCCEQLPRMRRVSLRATCRQECLHGCCEAVCVCERTAPMSRKRSACIAQHAQRWPKPARTAAAIYSFSSGLATKSLHRW